MKPLAQAFADVGFTVDLPLLPGHGTTPQDMALTRWADWSAAIEAAYETLAARCDNVVVAGLSMGGALTAWLGTRHQEIAALIAVNPLIDPHAPLWQGLTDAARASSEQFLPAVGSDIAKPGITESAYDAVPVAPLLNLTGPLEQLTEALPQITSPTLLFTSPHDHVVDPASSKLWAQRASGPVQSIEMPDSYHVATLDYDRERINTESVRFARQCLAQ
jgi:carboxylesterase